MLTSKFGDAITDQRPREMEDEIAWERAAKLLDIDRGVLRRARTPRMEWVSRHDCAAGAGSLYGATNQISNAGFATVLVGSAMRPAQVAEEAIALQMELALAASEKGGAAIGVQLPSTAVSERDIFDLARECAPVVSRFCGDARLLPTDTMSAAFSNWMASAPSVLGAKLRAPGEAPERYLAEEERRSAHAIAHLSAVALDEIGKKPRSARVAIIGLDALGRECMREMQELGVHIVAVADESGGLVNEAGIEIAPLSKHVEGGGLVAEYVGAEHIAYAEALALQTDVLLLTAHGRAVTEGNARSNASAVVVAGSRGCVSPGVSEDLSASGVIVIPNLLVRSCRWMGVEDLRLESAWKDLNAVRKTHSCSFSMAPLLLSLHRLAERERSASPWQTL
jgi:glutamate dehydrogenase/leucine dehydrogenase